jgi:hypothetical protein
MNFMRPFVSNGGGGGAAAGTALAPETREVPPARVPGTKVSETSQSTGYGLPCAKCRQYYPANLSACPICKTAQRVSPVDLVPTHAPAVSAAPSKIKDEEKERILREFKAQMYNNHTQIAATTPKACIHSNDRGKHEAATVCKACYARLQERVDVLEAALLIDPKEAAQIVYSAVWADTSDCNKTYHNAAQALLNEVRRRAGVKLVINRAQSLPH